MYQIEKNIPIVNNGAGRPRKYPFNEMGVGDSFFVPLNGQDNLKHLQKSLSASVRSYGVKRKMCFITRICVHQETDGVRVWRIS